MGVAGAQNANSRPLARYNKKAIVKGVGAVTVREKKRYFHGMNISSSQEGGTGGSPGKEELSAPLKKYFPRFKKIFQPG